MSRAAVGAAGPSVHQYRAGALHRRRIGRHLLTLAGGACLLLLFCPLGMATASANSSITITALGSQGYGALFPTFSYSYGSLPTGVTLSGFPSCTTVNGGTLTIGPSLPTGAYTIDGSTCTGVTASDPSYTIDYVGGVDGFVVGPATAPPRYNVIEAGTSAEGGVPFTYSAMATLSNTAGPENDPVTISVSAGPGTSRRR